MELDLFPPIFFSSSVSGPDCRTSVIPITYNVLHLPQFHSCLLGTLCFLHLRSFRPGPRMGWVPSTLTTGSNRCTAPLGVRASWEQWPLASKFIICFVQRLRLLFNNRSWWSCFGAFQSVSTFLGHYVAFFPFVLYNSTFFNSNLSAVWCPEGPMLYSSTFCPQW